MLCTGIAGSGETLMIDRTFFARYLSVIRAFAELLGDPIPVLICLEGHFEVHT